MSEDPNKENSVGVFSLFYLIIFSILFLSCKDQMTNPINNIKTKWYGQLSIDVVHSVIKPDGTVWSWGFNGAGTLGNGTTINSNVPVQALKLNDIISMDQFIGAAVAVDKVGNVWFWGNIETYLGPPDIDTNVTIPIKITQLNGIKTITMYDIFIFLLKDDATVWQIKMDWYTPTIAQEPIRLNIPNIVFIWKNIALSDEGKIYDLLSENYVQDSLSDIVSVSGIPNRHVLALKEDGTVLAWGSNNLGQLGNGTYDDSDVPIKVKEINDITSVSSIYDFNLALKKDGTVWFWGFEGQHGDTLISRNIPIKIEGLTDVVLIHSGYENLIMKNDGTYWIFNSLNKIPIQIMF